MQAPASYTNGASRHLPPGKAVAVAQSGVSSLDAVLGLGNASGRIVTGVVIAPLLHAAAGARAALIPVEMFHWTQHASSMIHDKLWSEIDLEIAKIPEPEPPPPPQEEAKEEPKEAPPPPPPPAAAAKPAPAEPPPPPAAAAAGAVLTSDPDPNEPVDLTNTFVTGTSTAFAGGTTQTGGTSLTAVNNPNARAGGVPGGTGTAVAPAAPAVDRSRVASCGGDANWDCPFPPEADTAQIDEAYVLLRATVTASGTVSKVEVLKDPGNGFGREAKRCAMARRCQPALDTAGNPVDGVSKQIRVSFTRN